MTDLLLRIRTPEGGTDLEIAAGDYALDYGLETAVLVSLFTDARAEPDQETPGEDGALRGWWGQDNRDPFGSLLWLVIERGVQTNESATLAATYARESLLWLVQEEIAFSVDVAAEYQVAGRLDLQVTITRGTSRQWAHLWTGQAEQILDLAQARVKLILR